MTTSSGIGTKLAHLVRGTESVHFYYDAQSRPAILEYKKGSMTNKYAYVYNISDDVVGILDSDKALAVEYKYDAWGKPLCTEGALASTIGFLNPFRYKGYIFDEETGYYYLKKRSFAPEMHRFINADAVLCADRVLAGVNQFLYCSNCPVLDKDIDGLLTWPGEIHAAVQWYIIGHCDGRLLVREVGLENIGGVVGHRGRIDLLDIETGEMWEVKPLYWSVSDAKDQLESYKTGNITASSIKNKKLQFSPALSERTVGGYISPGTFSYGSGDGYCYTVSYASYGNGIIYYSYVRNGKVRPEASYDATVERVRANSKLTVRSAIGICAAGAALELGYVAAAAAASGISVLATMSAASVASAMSEIANWTGAYAH